MADNHTYFVGEDGVLVHNYAETPWDAFSMAMGFVALDEAYKERDGFGVILAGTAIVADGAAFLLPVPGGAGFLVKAGRTGKEIIKNADEAAKELNRPYIRKSVREAVESAAPKTKDRKFIDPNTGKVIEGKYDLGHKKGNEFWREKSKAQKEGLSQKQFNDKMNDPKYYQIENPSSNRGRKYEKPK